MPVNVFSHKEHAIYTQQEIDALLSAVHEQLHNEVLIEITKHTDELRAEWAAKADALEARIATLEQGGGGTTPPPPEPEPEPEPPSGLNGLYLPIYSPAMRTASETYNPQMVGLPNLFTANPHSGPVPFGQRTDVEQNCRTLRQQNPACRVLGYIAIGWGRQDSPRKTLQGIKDQVDMWAGWNVNERLVDGVMWDEAPNSLSVLAFCREISDYARSKGLAYIRANPGTSVPEEYIELYDVTSINETSSLVSESVLQARTYSGKYPKSKFNYLAHTVQMDEAWLRMAKKHVGTIYITDMAGPPSNPWAQPATYIARQVEILKEPL